MRTQSIAGETTASLSLSSLSSNNPRILVAIRVGGFRYINSLSTDKRIYDMSLQFLDVTIVR
jgi:hypothetical protein